MHRGQTGLSTLTRRLHTTFIIGLVLAQLALSGCERKEIHHYRILQFGTIIDVTLVSNRRLAKRAIDMLEHDFAEMQHHWQVWKPGPLMVLNEAIRKGEVIQPHPSLIPLIDKAARLSRASGYLFNPAAGNLIALWGFHQDAFGRDSEPSTDAIARLLAANPTMDDLAFKDEQLQSDNRLVKLDFGGIAKGYGLGLEAEKLKALGINDFILNAGGDLVAFGRHPLRQWKIGVRKSNGRGSLATIEPRDGEAIFTSGDYERYYNSAHGRRHHIIDPRNGYPSHQAHAVTVIHTDPATADAAATALMIATPEERLPVAMKMGVDTFLILDWDNRLLVTPKMLKRIELDPRADVYTLLTNRDSSRKSSTDSNL